MSPPSTPPSGRRQEKTARLFALVSTAVLDKPDDAQEQEARGRLGARPFLAPAGIRGRPDRHQDDRQGRLSTPSRRRASSTRSAAGARCARRCSGRNPNVGKPDMMATHPSTPERIAQAVGGGAPVRRARRRRDRPRRLSHRDRRPRLRRQSRRKASCAAARFLHPKLGFAFEAPDGFALENQSRGADRRRRRRRARRCGSTAIAVDPVDRARGRARLRLDRRGARPPRSRSMKVDDLPDRDRRRAGRRSGASGSAPSGSTAAVYRLIFAAQALTPAVDARFRASIALVPPAERRRRPPPPQPQRMRDRPGGRRRHARHHGAADGDRRPAARPVPGPQRPREGCRRSSRAQRYKIVVE